MKAWDPSLKYVLNHEWICRKRAGKFYFISPENTWGWWKKQHKCCVDGHRPTAPTAKAFRDWRLRLIRWRCMWLLESRGISGTLVSYWIDPINIYHHSRCCSLVLFAATAMSLVMSKIPAVSAAWRAEKCSQVIQAIPRSKLYSPSGTQLMGLHKLSLPASVTVLATKLLVNTS